jgi:hypothetical protein
MALQPNWEMFVGSVAGKMDCFAALAMTFLGLVGRTIDCFAALAMTDQGG